MISIVVWGQNRTLEELYNDYYLKVSNLKPSEHSDTYNPVDGKHYFFYIDTAKQLMYRDENSGWKRFNTLGLDYKSNRYGDTIHISGLDMVSADGNRVLVKVKESNELYFALIDKKQESNQEYYIINDPQPDLGLTKRDVEGFVSKYNLIKTYSQKIGINLLTRILKKRHKKKPFWLVEITNAHTWYSLEYVHSVENQTIHGIAVTYVSPTENDSLHPQTSGYNEEIGGDYHWPLFNKWYNKWLRKDVKGNRHYTTFIDGAVGYYLLVKETNDFNTVVCKTDTVKKYRFNVLFTDEQTYFSERFRLIGPDESAPSYSAQKEALRSKKNLDNENYLPWRPEEHWWDFYDIYFYDCSIDGAIENIIVTTSHEIFSLNWTFWSMDFTWRTRNKPENAININASLNRNNYIIIPYNNTFFKQKLLPPDNLLPEPNNSPVYFIHEDSWEHVTKPF